MATADSIVRLKVENTEYDAKIKRAARGLQHLEDAAKKSGRSLTTLTKEEKEYISSLGKMETVSKSARGSLGELSTAFADLSVRYNRLTDEQKKGEYGTLLSKQMEQIRQRAIEARNELAEINNQLGDVKMSSSNFSSSIKDLATQFVGFTSVAGAASLAVGAIKSAIQNNIETAANFELAISKLSSLTGLTGDKLDYLKEKAIQLGGSTTQSASQVAEAFMLIGSKMPDLLGNADALSEVTEAAIRLAEASGDDVTVSANALTAALNIMGESADQASRYINVLAAGSKLGAANIPDLTDVIFKAGQAAKLNKLSFEELVAVAETIRPSFGTAAEAGTALNAMLLKMEASTDNNVKPSVVGLQTALNNLESQHMSSTAAIKAFTETGFKAYAAIMDNREALEGLTSGVTGTNTAIEQATTNTENLNGSLNKLSSAWEELNLRVNDSNGLLKQSVDLLTEIISWCSSNTNTIGKFWDAWVSGILRASGPLGALADTVRQLTGGDSTQGGGGTRRTVYKGKGGKVYNTEAEARASYAAQPKATPTPIPTPTASGSSGKSKGRTTTTATPIEQKLVFKTKFITEDEESKLLIEELKKKETPSVAVELGLAGKGASLSELEKAIGVNTDDGLKTFTKFDFDREEFLKKQREEEEKNKKNPMEEVGKFVSGLEGIAGGLKELGVEMPEGMDKLLGGINGLMSIIQGVQTVISVFGTSTQTANTIAVGANTAALAALTSAVTANTVTKIIPGIFANGGVVHAANGFVGGHSYSGDNIPALLNSGEVVLNQAQTANLATKLNNNAEQRMSAKPYLDCEKIYLGLNTYLGATGRGELVVSR